MNENDILKNVSRETIDKLKTYFELLCQWQNKFNLVSKNSLSDAWNRHFLDSAQLAQYIDDNISDICDFGSGAGFPGLVLAIIFQEKNIKTHFTLIESIYKKTLFLNEIINKFNLNAEVINERIENLQHKPFDLITARAVCSLEKLIKYIFPFCYKNTKCLFLKGQTFSDEIKIAEKIWKFSYNVIPNKLASDGVVLEIFDIRRKND